MAVVVFNLKGSSTIFNCSLKFNVTKMCQALMCNIRKTSSKKQNWAHFKWCLRIYFIHGQQWTLWLKQKLWTDKIEWHDNKTERLSCSCSILLHSNLMPSHLEREKSVIKELLMICAQDLILLAAAIISKIFLVSLLTVVGFLLLRSVVLVIAFMWQWIFQFLPCKAKAAILWSSLMAIKMIGELGVLQKKLYRSTSHAKNTIFKILSLAIFMSKRFSQNWSMTWKKMSNKNFHKMTSSFQWLLSNVTINDIVQDEKVQNGMEPLETSNRWCLIAPESWLWNKNFQKM